MAPEEFQYKFRSKQDLYLILTIDRIELFNIFINSSLSSSSLRKLTHIIFA